MTDQVLSVAYISPGWPLNSFPNGIVAYIENIKSGINGEIDISVLAHRVGDHAKEDKVINLSNIRSTAIEIRELSNKVMHRLAFPLVEELLYKNKREIVIQRILNGIQLLSTKPDFVEIEESFGFAAGLMKSMDIPIITRLHGPWFIIGPIMNKSNEIGYQLRVDFEGEAIKRARGISVPNLDLLNRVRDYYNLELAEAVIIPNPVKPVAKDKLWNYNPSNPPTLLFVGRFDLIKGADLALQAFRLVAQHYQDAVMQFIGPDNGVQINGAKYHFEEYVDQFIPEASIKQRIQFLGHCNGAKIAELRQQASVTLLTSRYENFPMSLLEAVSTGSPTVGTRVGGIKEIIRHGYNGLLAEQESAESIAEQVMQLLNNTTKMNEMSENAIVDSKKRFAPEVIAKQTITFYQSLLN